MVIIPGACLSLSSPLNHYPEYRQFHCDIPPLIVPSRAQGAHMMIFFYYRLYISSESNFQIIVGHRRNTENLSWCLFVVEDVMLRSRRLKLRAEAQAENKIKTDYGATLCFMIAINIMFGMKEWNKRFFLFYVDSAVDRLAMPNKLLKDFVISLLYTLSL